MQQLDGGVCSLQPRSWLGQNIKGHLLLPAHLSDACKHSSSPSCFRQLTNTLLWEAPEFKPWYNEGCDDKCSRGAHASINGSPELSLKVTRRNACSSSPTLAAWQQACRASSMPESDMKPSARCTTCNMVTSHCANSSPRNLQV
jgi:hypothetical protein